MKNKIITFYKNIKKLSYQINPSVFASSISFYIIITIIPIFYLLNGILYKLELTKITLFYIPNNILTIIIMTISLLWSSSKLINNLMLISNIVFKENINKSKIKIRIESIITTIILIIMIVIMISIVLYIVYLKNAFNTGFYVLFDLILYIIILGFVFTIITGLYKHFIPVKINYKDVMLSSTIITIILFFMTIIYQTLIKETLIAKFINVYGNFTSLIVTFLWLYYNCYIFLIGFGLIIFKNTYK